MRASAKDTRGGILAYQYYLKFWKINYGTTNKTFEQFSDSSLFTDFLKFANHIIKIDAVNPDAFFMFLIKNTISINKWTHKNVYDRYIRELNKQESFDSAIERNFKLMQKWADDNNDTWTNFFKNVEPSLATLWFETGRISPWVFYTASTANCLFVRMTEEQIDIVYKAIDPNFWDIKLSQYAEDVKFLKQELLNIGI